MPVSYLGCNSIQHWFRFVLILALMFPVVVLPQGAAAADAFDALRDRWEFLLSGNDTYDPAGSIFANTLNRLTPVAQSFWNSMDTFPACTALWSDLAGTTRFSDISNTYGRLRLMARMYAAHGLALQGNVELRADLLSALGWMYNNRYNESKNQYDNWFERCSCLLICRSIISALSLCRAAHPFLALTLCWKEPRLAATNTVYYNEYQEHGSLGL